MRYRKRALALLMAVMLVPGLLAGCKKEEAPEDPVTEETETGEPAAEETEVVSELEAVISWWTYPIFVQDDGSVDGTYEQQLIEAFQKKYPNITVNLEVLDFETGKDKIDAALADGSVCDVLFANAENIAPYQEKGALLDLSSLFTDEMLMDLYEGEFLSACQEGVHYYMYPLSISNYVMAFNKSALEQSGAMELMPADGVRSWTADEFEAVISKLKEAGYEGGSFYCSGHAGDYGTRSFVTNLYDAELTNEAMDTYAINSDNGKKAMEKIKEWVSKGYLQNGAEVNGAQAVESFVNGSSSFTLLWNLPHELYYEGTMGDNGVEPYVMMYPSADGRASLEYILNGFAVFDHQDDARAEASRYLIDFLCNDEAWKAQNVARTGAFSVRQSLGDVYGENEQAALYQSFVPYSGIYYQKLKGFDKMRIYWYQMEKEILSGEYSVSDAMNSFVEYANKTLKD